VNYQEIYRRTFAKLGYSLTLEQGVTNSELMIAEADLEIRLPLALRDYYRVCGNEQILNQAHNRLLPPQKWVRDGEYLIFMEENQAVVLWSVKISEEETKDSPAFQASNAETLEWEIEHENLSVFLVTMLHWQASFGGMAWYATASVSPTLTTILDRDWQFVGEINQMRAYNRQNQAICFLPWEDSWRIFAGAKKESDLERTAEELSLEWEELEETEYYQE
jgi:hypothetical protein